LLLLARVHRPRAPPASHLPRVGARGEEERRRRADLELCLAAPLLDSSSPPAGRPFRGAAPASLLGHPHLPWSRSSISVAAGIGHPHLRVRRDCLPPSAVRLSTAARSSRVSASAGRLPSAWCAPASSMFLSVPPSMPLPPLSSLRLVWPCLVPGAWYPVSALSIVVFNALCSAFAHAACPLL
jgi:hypothetical protein